MSELQSLADTAAADLSAFEELLRNLPDARLHQAHPDGGWTVAQIVSHIHMSGLLFVANLQRLRFHDHLFMYREEWGHDVLGAPPHSSEEAAGRIASLRIALSDCLPATDATVLAKTVEVPPFGTLVMGRFAVGIVRHLHGHAEQARAILVNRGAIR